MKREKIDSEPAEKKNMVSEFMKNHAADHYNGIPQVRYKISTGSLKLDAQMEGGYGPGIHRMAGSSEGGKTSHTLKVASNFLETVENSKVLYIKAEGRLSEKVKIRSGMKFTEDPLEWHVGTCFIYKSNIYDSVAELIDLLIKNNPNDHKYMFIIDSVDAMIMKGDRQKSMDGDDAVKVAGPNVLTKLLFKKTSLAASTMGHMIFVIAQVIAKIEVGHKKPDQLNVGGGGGNAQIHFADWILQFLPRFNKDYILKEGDKVIFDAEESNIVGHWCNILISKSTNEKTGQTVKYPIRHNSSGEGSIWTELEIKSLLESFRLVESKGAWVNFNDTAMQLMSEAGLTDVPQKINGTKKFLIEVSRPEVLSFWKKYISNILSADEIL